jgi:hypothetical protein
MQTGGASILPRDSQHGVDGEAQGISREAVLLQWERKIEEAERRPGRFQRSQEEPDPSSQGDHGTTASVSPLTEDATHTAPRRFERAPGREAPAAGRRAVAGGPIPGRRTITITGQPVRPRRRRSVVENQLAQPDRIALWAFLLGLFLVAVAAGTAHA